ncbi:R3HC1 protein, partial [Psilopogon haemacephalus]|nr:R3HC1 protein [Psilopogon haemacephalus]
ATLALRCMDGVFLSPSEDEFVGRITEELEHFMLQGQHHRVLLFPPLSSRLRYLIHRTVENVDLLSSFSVGEGWRRRTVICHTAVRLPTEPKASEQKPSSNPPRLHRPAQPWGRGGRGARQRHRGDMHGGDSSRACVGSGRIQRPPRRKPDKVLYVPKAMRRKAEWGEQESSAAGSAQPPGDAAGGGGEICPKASLGDAQEELGKPEGGSDDASLTLLEEPGGGCASGGGGGGGGSSSAQHPACGTGGPAVESSQDGSGQERQTKDCSGSLSSVHNNSPRAAEEPDLSCDSDHSEKEPVAEEEDKEALGLWDELRLPAGDKEQSPGQSSPEDDCTAELFAEIVGNLTVKDISIERINFDYSSYGSAQLSEGDLGHVTEIYDFSPSMKTEHLLEVFSDFQESGFKIQWVDDTHALGIFSSPSTASQALGRRYPALKIRPLIHATKQSKLKALQRPKLLHLAKERPQTDTVVAKRLVSRALGLKNKQQADDGGSGTDVMLPESLEQEE